MIKTFTLKVTQKTPGSHMGSLVELSPDGTLMITGFDGITVLNAAEALKLARALVQFAGANPPTENTGGRIPPKNP